MLKDFISLIQTLIKKLVWTRLILFLKWTHLSPFQRFSTHKYFILMLIALIPDTYFIGTYMHRAIIRCNNMRVYMGCLMRYFEKKYLRVTRAAEGSATPRQCSCYLYQAVFHYNDCWCHWWRNHDILLMSSSLTTN